MSEVSQAMKDAGLKAVYALQATGQGSFTKDPEAYVKAIAEAVIDNEAFDRGLVIAALRGYAFRAYARGEFTEADTLREQADLMEGV